MHQKRTPVLISHEVDMYRSVMICINQSTVPINHEVALYQSVTRQICTDQLWGRFQRLLTSEQI